MTRFLAPIVFAYLVGCGSSGANPSHIIQVAGKAVAGDGQPARWLTLTFYPTTPGSTSAYGVVGADGKFTPKTLGNQDGIVPGMYKVVVSPQPRGTRIARNCTAEDTTDLQVEVKQGDTELLVRLK